MRSIASGTYTTGANVWSQCSHFTGLKVLFYREAWRGPKSSPRAAYHHRDLKHRSEKALNFTLQYTVFCIQRSANFFSLPFSETTPSSGLAPSIRIGLFFYCFKILKAWCLVVTLHFRSVYIKDVAKLSFSWSFLNNLEFNLWVKLNCHYKV